MLIETLISWITQLHSWQAFTESNCTFAFSPEGLFHSQVPHTNGSHLTQFQTSQNSFSHTSDRFSGICSLKLCWVLKRHHFHHMQRSKPHNPCPAFNSCLLSWSRTKQMHPQLLAPCSTICSWYLWGTPGLLPLPLTQIRGLVLCWLPQFYFEDLSSIWGKEDFYFPSEQLLDIRLLSVKPQVGCDSSWIATEMLGFTSHWKWLTTRQDSWL